MRNIIVKVPTLIFFLGLVAGPVISALMKINHSTYYTWTNLFLLDILQWGVIGIWISSLVAYFSFEGNSNKNNTIIFVLIALTSATSIVYEFVWYSWILYGLSIVSFIACVVLIVPKIKKVFYARSTWFIVIELLLLPIGILTLTPEVKRWEKSNKL